MIKAIIFDCFGVLTSDLWKEFLDGIDEPAAVDKARELNRAYDGGYISTEQFLEEVKEVTGKEPARVESVFKSETDITKNTELLTYIKSLKQNGYKIGLLSNVANNWIRDSFLTPEEQKLFDDMVFSFEHGMAKPDPRIFRLSCERLGVTTEEAVIIDDIERYCRAGEEEGMQAIVYKNLSQMKNDLNKILHK